MLPMTATARIGGHSGASPGPDFPHRVSPKRKTALFRFYRLIARVSK
jgi:hypothetical protein